MAAIIEVDKLSKQYLIRHELPAGNFREAVGRGLKKAVRRLWPPARRQQTVAGKELFSALQDISFRVQPGDKLGIIGRNGAGKSTLLKLLSRITVPSGGRFTLRGKVASLLEVGTGFHPELTGRENIFLNGAILGMARSEIKTKFDEIVDFAGVERFLDTPVKRYSSGMYVRLAFAVAAHLEPEILIVDEVLAVGDIEFQKKCLGKMSEVSSKQGRTVLFVSHNMNAIETLCDKCLLLEGGRLKELGKPLEVIGNYLSTGEAGADWRCPEGNSQVSNPCFNPVRFCLVDSEMKIVTGDVAANDKVGILFEGITEELQPAFTMGFAVYTQEGSLLFWSLHTDRKQKHWPRLERGRNVLIAWLPQNFLNEGNYRVELHMGLHFQEWFSQPGVNAPFFHFNIRGGLSESPYWIMARPGLLAPIIPFQRVSQWQP